MKIQKYQLWLAFFFFIFGITFSMIIWTVKSAVDTPVFNDKSFMTSYQDVDENFNSMILSNKKFNDKYRTEIIINDKKLGMGISDLRYGQRSLEKMSKNQNILHVGENNFSLSIIDKISKQPVKNAKIVFQVTRPIQDKYDINLDNFRLENDSYHAVANIEKIGNWNVMGKVVIGNDIGYFYIKSNTKK